MSSKPKGNNHPVPHNRNDTRSVVKETAEGTVMASMRASILPPPSEMEQYEKHCPGITRTLMESYIKQVDHRIQLEKHVITSKEKRADRGQIFALILGVISLSGGFVLIAFGMSGFGIAAIIGSIATLLSAFYGAALLQRRERLKKSENNK
jgi:uncharacterized membrane protein